MSLTLGQLPWFLLRGGILRYGLRIRPNMVCCSLYQDLQKPTCNVLRLKCLVFSTENYFFVLLTGRRNSVFYQREPWEEWPAYKEHGKEVLEVQPSCLAWVYFFLGESVFKAVIVPIWGIQSNEPLALHLRFTLQWLGKGKDWWTFQS